MLFYDTGFKVLQVAVRLCRIRTQNFTFFLGGGVKTVELTLLKATNYHNFLLY